MVMKFPVCNLCVKSGEFCDKCKSASKGITKQELEVYKKIHKSTKNMEHLKDVEIKRAITNDNFSIIFCNKEDISKIIGKNGIIAKKIEKSLSRKIIIAPYNADVLQFSKEILRPINIIGVNVVYDGDKNKYVVRVPESDKKIMKIDPSFFSLLASKILKVDAEINFE
ncbi:MAG: hypothetical protein QXM68_00010 [Candidatus Aenigmatarchaeota archaeon]|nr:hypothetical protein [Candidatus Aenigmarchaeota archaeon]